MKRTNDVDNAGKDNQLEFEEQKGTKKVAIKYSDNASESG